MLVRKLSAAALLAALALVPAVLVSSGAPQEQPPRPVFRTDVELVQIDVSVVDGGGRPVRGLTKDDFLVFERSTERPLAVFEELSHEPRPWSLLPPTTVLDVADNTAARSDRIVVLVLDDLRFQGKTEEVKHMARRIVNEIGVRASMALVTTSGRFGVEPTDDRALLLNEIDRFVDRFDPEGRRLARGAVMPHIRAGRGPADPASFFATMTQYKTLEDVAEKIGEDHGLRKILVWISGGNRGPVEEPEGRLANVNEAHHLGALAGALDSMRKSGVSTYSIATRDFNDRPLRTISDASGGFVVRAADFDRELHRLVSALDHYYLLGFYPIDSRDKGYRSLEVRIRRDGATVRHRPGFDLGGRPTQPKNKNPLARLAAGVVPASDLPLRMAATGVPNTSTHARVGVTIDVRAPRESLLESDGTLRDTLRYAVWAVDLKRKKAGKTTVREARVVLTDRGAPDGRSPTVAYQVQTSLALPPGRYQLRASASSAKLGTGGSVYLQTEVPEFLGDEAQLGGILLGYASGPRVPVIPNPLVSGLFPFEPTHDREFGTADTVRVFFVGTAGSVPTDMTVDLVNGNDQVLRTLERRRVTSMQKVRLDLTLPLVDLQPGGYRLRVSAGDNENVTEREVGFVVR